MKQNHIELKSLKRVRKKSFTLILICYKYKSTKNLRFLYNQNIKNVFTFLTWYKYWLKHKHCANLCEKKSNTREESYLREEEEKKL